MTARLIRTVVQRNTMTYNAEVDAMVRFLLQDKTHAGDERCPDCSSGEMQVKRGPFGNIGWALCEDCGYSLVTSSHHPPRDLSELPDEIQAYYNDEYIL